MKKHHLLLILAFGYIISYSSCNRAKQSQNATNENVIDGESNNDSPLHTINDGVLSVLMDNSMTSYFIYRGEPMGFEYEMLELFAQESDLQLDVKIIYDVENILDSLVAGRGDLVAANLTISEDRLARVAFSSPLFRTKQVLVQRLPDNREKMTADEIEQSLIRDRLDLKGKTITVRKNSSYELILQNLIRETGLNITIDYAAGDAVTEQLIELVSNKEIDYTICDLNKAELFNAYYDNLDIETPMSLSQPIAWAVNQGSTELLAALNTWIEKREGSLEFNMINNRYFDINRHKKSRIITNFDYVKDGKISDYDELIKKYAADLSWDWRLLTAQIYKESRFDPNTKSWRGAVGLMQLMPRTAQEYGIAPNQLTNPETNIQGGIRHLKMLEDRWKEELTDSLEILKFTLGSYNVGHGHVQDAIRLAEKYDLNPSVWDDNVAQMLLNKSIPKYYKDPVVAYGYCRGKEPVSYVKTIFDSYDLYKQFTD